MVNQMKKDQVKIRHVGPILYVKDRKTTLDYYSKLGFHCDYEMGFVERDSVEWIVHETSNVDRITPNYPTHGELALDMHCMVVSIEKLFEEFKSRGAAFNRELSLNEYGMKQFSIVDPDGYTIGFGE
jgi:catechol 2,3-dioxygenase-like lactoylglutathione lyase family enzyme